MPGLLAYTALFGTYALLVIMLARILISSAEFLPWECDPGRKGRRGTIPRACAASDEHVRLAVHRRSPKFP